MNSFYTRPAVLALGLVFAWSASAVTYEYFEKDKDHYFHDTSAWAVDGTPTGSLPVEGNVVQVSALDNSATTWLTNDFNVAITEYDVISGTSTDAGDYTFTFIGRKGVEGSGDVTTLSPPDRSAANFYNEYPVRFMAYSKGLSGYQDIVSLYNVADRTKGAFAFTGFDVRVRNADSGAFYVTFAEGAYNFGRVSGSALYLGGASEGVRTIPRYVRFAPGTILRFDTAYVSPQTGTAYKNLSVDFDGLTQMIGSKLLCVRQGVAGIHGATHLVVPSVQVEGGRLNIHGKGTAVDASTGFTLVGGTTVVSNGAHVTAGKIARNASSANVTFIATGTGTCVTVAGMFQPSYDSHVIVEKGAAVSAAPIRCYAYNSDFTVNEGGALTNLTAEMVFGGGDMTKKPQALYVNGGTFYSNQRMSLNNNSLIEVNGGTAYLQTAFSDNIMMGWNTQSNAIVRVNGGYATTYRIRMGRNPADSSYSKVEVNGGRFRVSGYINFHQLNSYGKGLSELVLNGGALEVGNINGNNQDTNGDMTDDIIHADLIGDGGTLKAIVDRATAAAPFIEAMRHTYCGVNALTLDTTNLTVYLNHPLENKKDAKGVAVNGVFRKIGSGTLIFATNAHAVAETTVSKIEVGAGTFKFAEGMTLGSTALAVDSGATLALDAGVSVSVKGFSAENATISLAAGSTITVTTENALSLSGVTFKWATLPSTATSVFIVKGQVDAETQREIRKSLFSGLSSDYQTSFDFIYDASTGQTTVKASYIGRADPLTATAVWTGRGAWAASSNWKDLVKPDANRIAVFGEGAASKEVTVSTPVTAGGLRFTETGYAIASITDDAKINMDALVGAGLIETSPSTTNTIAAKMDMLHPLTATVAKGAELTFAGSLSGSPISKSGAGVLTYGATNAFIAGSTLSMSGGLTKVTSANALGSTIWETFCIDSGKIDFESANEGVLDQGSVLMIGSATASPGMVIPSVFNVNTEASFARLGNQRGLFSSNPIKIGTEKLTLNLKPDEANYIFVANTDGSLIGGSDLPTVSLKIPEDGSRPSGRYASFTVAEGELCFKGTKPSMTLLNPHNIDVGTAYAAGVKPAELTIDNCTLKMTDTAGTYYGTLNTGYCINEPGYCISNNNPIVRVINGGVFEVNISVPGYAVRQPGTVVTFALTNGTFRTWNMSYLSRMYNETNASVRARYWMKDSTLSFAYGSGTVYLGGGAEIIADNSFFGGRNGAPLKLIHHDGEHDRFYGDFFFYNGSVFAVASIADTGKGRHTATFAFDDATWKWANDYGDFTNPIYPSGKYVFEMRGKGVHLKPAAEATFTTLTPFTGEGGMIMGGAGTVKFGSGAYGFTGVCALTNELGTVDLTDAGLIAEAAFSGVGTVKGATITQATIASDLADDWSTESMPVFRDSTVTRLLVDAGRTSENPLPLDLTRETRVAKIEGSTNLKSFKLVNTGSDKVSGNFTVKDGYLVLLPSSRRSFTFIYY